MAPPLPRRRIATPSLTSTAGRTIRRSIAAAASSLPAGPFRSALTIPEVLATVALVLGHFGEDIDAAIGLIDRSVALNPSFARGWAWSGALRLCAGQRDVALAHIETFLRLSPRGRLLAYPNLVGQAISSVVDLTRQ
jgi:hypothetical protein